MAIGLSAPKTIEINQPVTCGKSQTILFNRDYQVTNTGDKPENYQFSIQPVSESGFLIPKTEWFSISPNNSFTIESGKTQGIDQFKINVDCNNLVDGKYMAFLQTSPVIERSAKDGAAASVNYGVGTKITFTAVGGVQEEQPATVKGIANTIKEGKLNNGQIISIGIALLLLSCFVVAIIAGKLGKRASQKRRLKGIEVDNSSNINGRTK